MSPDKSALTPKVITAILAVNSQSRYKTRVERVCNTLIGMQEMPLQHCVRFLLGHKFVHSSRGDPIKLCVSQPADRPQRLLPPAVIQTLARAAPATTNAIAVEEDYFERPRAVVDGVDWPNMRYLEFCSEWKVAIAVKGRNQHVTLGNGKTYMKADNAKVVITYPYRKFDPWEDNSAYSLLKLHVAHRSDGDLKACCVTFVEALAKRVDDLTPFIKDAVVKSLRNEERVDGAGDGIGVNVDGSCDGDYDDDDDTNELVDAFVDAVGFDNDAELTEEDAARLEQELQTFL